MITSRSVLDVLDLLLADDVAHVAVVREQVGHVTIDEVEYIEGGALYRFALAPEAVALRLPGTIPILNGVAIRSPEYPGKAEVFLHCDEGLVCVLEILSKLGYPDQEPSSYSMVQAWPGSPGRTIQRDP